MAARRLVIVMVVMLGISSLAALLAPTAEREETTTDTTTTPRERGPEPSGQLVRATIDASASVRTIRIDAGDQLALVVRDGRPDGVEIPRLGEFEDLDRDSPARFDLLPPTGRYPIRLAEAGKVIGEIVVRASGSPRRG